MNKKRLLKLADFLENEVPTEQFDMHNWWEEDWWEEEGEEVCRTAGCALGWATKIPSFKRAGLHLDKYGDYFVPKFGEQEDFDAGADFFGLTEGQAMHLFESSTYASYRPRPKTVAKRIRKLVESGRHE